MSKSKLVKKITLAVHLMDKSQQNTLANKLISKAGQPLSHMYGPESYSGQDFAWAGALCGAAAWLKYLQANPNTMALSKVKQRALTFDEAREIEALIKGDYYKKSA